MSKSKKVIDCLKNELKIIRRLNDPTLITFYENYETEKELIIVMELVHGGELF